MKTKTLALLLSTVMLAAVSHADTSGSVMGTVKAVSTNSITVETMAKAPKSVTITVLPSTKFIKDGVVTSLKDLKVGDGVVVSIKPNGDMFEAVSVTFGQMFQHMDMHHK
jgi:catabolite regulation protein CreA